MKNFKQLMVVAVIVIPSMPIMAQLSSTSGLTGNSEFETSYNQLTVGYNAILTSGDIVEFDGDPININGIAMKYVRGFGLSKQYQLYIETGLRANLNFWSESVYDDYEEEKGDFSLRTMSLAIPVNIAYRFHLEDNISLQPYTGLNLKANIHGKYKVLGESYNAFEKDYMDYTWKRFQMGWQIGLGLNLNKFYMGVEYGLDFMALAKKMNTSHLGLGIGVNF